MIDFPETEGDRQARHQAEQLQLTAAAKERAARARSAAEWFDIFIDVVEQGVRQGLEMNKRGHEILDVLAEHRPSWRRVREALSAQGLELNEGVEVEGPVIGHNQLGIPEVIGWPMGPVAKLYWTDGSKLEFTGKAALVAASFIIWWTGFNQVHMVQFGGDTPPPQSRIVEPGSDDYLRYIQAKAKAQESPEP